MLNRVIHFRVILFFVVVNFYGQFFRVIVYILGTVQVSAHSIDKTTNQKSVNRSKKSNDTKT